MKNIRNKRILITGGAGGIGRLMALDFASRGGQVIVWDIGAEALRSLEADARARGLALKGVVCDVTRREEVYQQAKLLQEREGPVDVLVNNAGVVSGSTFLETPDERIIRTMEVNTMAHFWTCKAFLPGMIERNSGHLVTISSAAGLIGVKGLADYSASKFAVFGLHEAIRMELRRLKSAVKTTVVCPFFIDTGMFEGVKTRLPLFLPILKSEYAARRIVGAVLRDRKQLIMPRFVYSVLLLRIFPPGFLDWSADWCGISNTMDEFKGRENHG